jgi:hypothetical protein
MPEVLHLAVISELVTNSSGVILQSVVKLTDHITQKPVFNCCMFVLNGCGTEQTSQGIKKDMNYQRRAQIPRISRLW